MKYGKLLSGTLLKLTTFEVVSNNFYYQTFHIINNNIWYLENSPKSCNLNNPKPLVLFNN